MSKNNQPAVKLYPTLGCCGIDCGLCPRYYTVGASRCPGCGGPDFANKRPSCPFVTCCVKRKGLEVCAHCAEFPCSRFEGWDAREAFVTHQKSISNLKIIKQRSQAEFIEQQKRRINLLETMLENFDEGRSKSFYCLAAALLPITDLEASIDKAEQELSSSHIELDDFKAKASIIRLLLNGFADERGIELKLRNK